MKNNIILKIEIIITNDDIAHTKITCGEDRSYSEVLNGLKLCQHEIGLQIFNGSHCPFSKT